MNLIHNKPGFLCLFSLAFIASATACLQGQYPATAPRPGQDKEIRTREQSSDEGRKRQSYPRKDQSPQKHQPKFSAAVRDQDCGKLRDFLIKTIKAEKEQRTDSKSVVRRWEVFADTVASLPKVQCSLSQGDFFDISGMISNDLLQDAGNRFHSLVSGLNLTEFDACCKFDPSRIQTESDLTLAQLAELEKVSPSDLSNIRRRWPRLVRITIRSGHQGKLLPSKDYMDSLSEEARLLEQLKAYKQAISVNTEPQSSSSPHTGDHRDPQGARGSPPSAKIDKELAVKSFYKAMRYYADKKLKKAETALEEAYRSDPNNREISRALERIKKDILLKEPLRADEH